MDVLSQIKKITRNLVGIIKKIKLIIKIEGTHWLKLFKWFDEKWRWTPNKQVLIPVYCSWLCTAQ